VSINLATGAASGGDAAGDIFGSIENLIGTGFADILIGDGGANVMSGGVGSDTFDAGGGNDVVTGGDGDDTILLGAGIDTFIWNPGDDNDLVEGQGDFDTLDFNGANVAENISIFANGGRAVFTRNVANVTMDLNDVEAVNFDAFGGADNITINDMSGTDVTNIRIDLGLLGVGDGQVDTIIINATNGDDVVLVTGANGSITVTGLATRIDILNFEAQDRLIINSLAGDDVIDGSNLLGTGLALTADGGNDADVLIGGDGDDTLLGGAGDDVLIGGPGIDTLDGGTGSNVLIQ
jgi:Ca2+-binding RTX toxin-like protein